MDNFIAPFVLGCDSQEERRKASVQAPGVWALIASVPAADDEVWIDYLTGTLKHNNQPGRMR